MSYKVRIHPLVVSQIRGWHLPDDILIEVNHYLREVLPSDLEHNLNRAGEPFDRNQGMTCSFTRRDHHVLEREHHFIFHVFFSQDEEALCVQRGAYEQEDAL